MSIDITGGDKWKDVLIRLARERIGVKVGVLEGATTDEGESIAEYAFYDEYGTVNNPAHPFMRETVREKQASWAELVARNITADPESIRRAMDLFGGEATADIVDKIRSNMAPANSDATIARKRKKSSDEPKTLMDDMNLVRAINYQIVEGK